jgi:hypothetical protein
MVDVQAIALLLEELLSAAADGQPVIEQLHFAINVGNLENVKRIISNNRGIVSLF